MLYNLTDQHYPWLAQRGMGFFRLLLDPQFRAVLAVILGFGTVMGLGKRTVLLLRALKIGDQPEFHNADLNALSRNKRDVPTMGGVLIVGAILLPTLLLADLRNFYVHMAILCALWLAALGGFDDWLKLTTARRLPGSRDGLFTWEKLVFQLGLAVLLGLFIRHHGLTAGDDHLRDMTFSLNIPFMRTWVWDKDLHDYVASPDLLKLSATAFVLLSVLVVAGSSNAVNLTDGMDGLAAGIMVIVSFAFLLLCLLAGDEGQAKRLLVPYVPRSQELAVVAGAMAGACLAFLWFNANPAVVFMGDTGSLALGGLIGYIAVVIRQEVLLMIIGGVFVLEVVSVMLQVSYFKYTRRRFGEGRRIFRMTPIHHHFHLSGIAEQKVVVRFWLVSALLAALALATIKLR